MSMFLVEEVQELCFRTVLSVLRLVHSIHTQSSYSNLSDWILNSSRRRRRTLITNVYIKLPQEDQLTSFPGIFSSEHRQKNNHTIRAVFSKYVTQYLTYGRQIYYWVDCVDNI